MELLQLRYFYESAQNENFSHTARAHRVPPSAVSLAVKRLERELGVPLFTREGNRIRLNAHGRRLQQALRVSLGELDAAVEAIAQGAPALSGEISLSIRCHRSTVTRHIATFKQAHPQVTFRVSHDFGSGTAGYDVIVDDDTANYPGFCQIPLMTEPLWFAAAANSPLAGRVLTWNDLQKADFITMSRAAPLRRVTDRVCRLAGFEPRVIIECDDPYYLRDYVRQGFGVTLIPELSWKSELDAGIVPLHTPAITAERTVCLYHRQPLSPAAVAFCRAVQEECQ